VSSAKRSGRSLIGLFAALAFATSGRQAIADDPTHACVAAADEGQRLRDAGKLGAGREALLGCAAESCPTIVRESCARWIGEIDARLPTIVLSARDERGADLPAVRVSIDGRLAAPVLDGRSLAIDPGPHEIVFEARGRRTARQLVIAREGEKVRAISAVLVADEAVAAPKTRPSLVPVVIFGGVTAAALGSFAVLGASGESEREHLEATCAGAHTCSPGATSAARGKLIAADVSLVVALGSATVTGVLLARYLGSAPKPAGAVGWSWKIAPNPRGGFATFGGRF
jgi:hypothetical protein